MARKKAPENRPKEAPFRATPFSALKGISISAPPAKQEPSRPPVVQPPTAITDDSALFLQAMEGVRKVDGDRKGADGAEAKKTRPDTVKPPVAVPAEVDRVERETFAQAIGRLKLDKTFSEQVPEDEELKPLGGNRLRQLKRGVITLDRQLDLHGLTREEALEALSRFLKSAGAHGEKAVLVITGKGNNSPGEPVLQQAVAGWLRETGRQFVVEFAPAPREMGGSGAFVVFLRPVKPIV
ncbi:Smr/MutS family protein [Geobacter sp. SVR]|uniref:Smr/MutS family protein n=1 Tax=Geobacter sp. SVR TaxID=2495594 RepID=UPI00143EFFD1|nr:Smr/MutS family protein [Geobacter sp. SVR]BCS52096.1 DNA mismatch repair protein MutS [Geobacter sp. SVR]GCF86551.1 DNA mismatch repair protein MutS [Geobacter sp. SVR]